jgi:hypothetical protein
MNPRLSADGDGPSSQSAIFQALWREFAVDELASSIAANGYFPYEPLIAIEVDGNLVVVEGNRRLAALKALLGLEQVDSPAALPEVTPDVLRDIAEVPVVITERREIWQYIGFKHVNGPQAWQSVSKAKYIADVHAQFNVSLEQIAAQIGDRHSTVLRLYRAWRVLEQAEEHDVFNIADRWKPHFSFSHLYTGLDYSGIANFIQVAPAQEQRSDPVPPGGIKPLGEACAWLYGSRSRQREPVVVSQNPDLRILDEVIQSPNGLAALRNGLPLRTSREIGKGDPLVLRESLVAAKNFLQTARAKVITGVREDDAGLFDLAQDIYDLAEAIVDDMKRARRRQGVKQQDDNE